MNRLSIFLTCFLVGNLAFGQVTSAKARRADLAYERFDYAGALEIYNQAANADLATKRKKAMCHWQLNESEKALSLFKEIVKTEGHTTEDIYNYAALLRENRRYEEANEWMKKFVENNSQDSRGQLFLKEKDTYQRLLQINPDYNVKNLSINTENQEFGAVFYQDKVVFVSSLEGTKLIRRTWNWNKLPFLDIYIGDRTPTNDVVKAELIEGSLNKKYHDGPATFNSGGNMMVFTRNNYEEKSSTGEINLALYSTKLLNGKWQKPTALPFNNSEYSVGQPSLSKDGKTLYFVSDMAGGIGGTDIYKVEINTDGSYGVPVNLGDKINTEGDEMFPFIHAGGEMLFYSSNGRFGLGGQDVFLAHLKGEQGIGKVMNLGAPINSNKDDFSFVLNEDQTWGYFSSNRDGGKGSDDIYGFDLKRPFSFGKTIQGIAKDKDGEILAETEVTLFNLLTGDQEVIITDQNGEFDFNVEEDKTFNIRGKKAKYFDGTTTVDTHTKDEIIEVNLILEKNPGLSLYALITSKLTGEPLDSVKITLLDNMTGKAETIYTKASGDYLKPLKDKRIHDRGSYNLILEKKGFLAKTVTYNIAFEREGKYEIHKTLDLTLEKIEVGADLSKIINLKPIYFDLGKYNIRPDAALELDKIVKVMNENPQMVIELGSHTDARGSATSNEKLSDKRAKASAAYIAERITNPQRISGKGYGEYRPTTADATIDGGLEKQTLTEDFINRFKSSNKAAFEKYHQLNRRTEFIIVEM